MKLSKEQIKEIGYKHGASLVGIASVDRFTNSPKGHSPIDKLPGCNSVIVLACTFAKEILDMDTFSYTAMRNAIIQTIDILSDNVAKELKKQKIKAKAIHSIGGKWEDGHFHGPISLKHAAELAGLGVIGRNYLLINNKYGNLLWFGAVLTTLELESDPLADYTTTCDDCSLCVDICPSSALSDERQFNQKSCYKTSYKLSKGVLELKCWECRRICPHRFGVE